jgi:hypothetical protein
MHILLRFKKLQITEYFWLYNSITNHAMYLVTMPYCGYCHGNNSLYF